MNWDTAEIEIASAERSHFGGCYCWRHDWIND